MPKDPAWSRDGGYLIFSDTPADRSHEVDARERHRGVPPFASGPSGNAFDAEGRLLTCETRTGASFGLDKKGAIEVLAEALGRETPERGRTTSWCSKNGHIYFTDPAFGDQADHRELDFYGVYHIPPKAP